jgi:hypothetical protein
VKLKQKEWTEIKNNSSKEKPQRYLLFKKLHLFQELPNTFNKKSSIPDLVN